MERVIQRDVRAEQEIKRMRGIISCAECRRLKLKCDKKIPCSSCQRRGCASICPNGCLTTGQGTRFVLADTEQLHNKLAQMSNRIRILEEALAQLHRQAQTLSSTEITIPTVHPLLAPDLLTVKTLQEMLVNPDTVAETSASGRPGEEASGSGPSGVADRDTMAAAGTTDYVDAFGTLAIADDGAARFYGRSGGQESLLLEEIEESERTSSVALNPLPGPIKVLADAFPFSPVPFPPEYEQLTIHVMISNFLPVYEDALRLCELYLDQAPWFFGPVTRTQLMTEVLPSVYEMARSDASRPSTSSSPSTTNASPHSTSSPMAYSGISPTLSVQTQSHSSGSPGVSNPAAAWMPPGTAIALLSIVLAIGSLIDRNLPPAPYNAQAEHYYQLTRAALTTMPSAFGTEANASVLERAPSIATVQTLSMMAIYQGMAMKENGIESTWALMGIATKLAQSIGLHRDSARWKLDAKEVQKRRALFWELFITDSWQSLATGRPPSFTLSFVDCELPNDPDATLDEKGETQPSFPAWKARFGAECVTYVVEGTLTAKSVKYDTILDLDRRVRNIGIPAYAEAAERVMKQEGLKDRFSSLSQCSLNELMKQLMPVNYRGFILVYLHRSFFAQALTDHPIEPRRSQYALSFVAAFEAACSVLGAVRAQFGLFPESISRFWPLWTHAFSSAIIIGSVVTRGSRSRVAPSAMAELNAARALFEKAAEYGGRAKKMLPVLVRMHEKAKTAIDSARHSTELIRNPSVSSGSRRASGRAAASASSNRPSGTASASMPVLAPTIRAGDRDDEGDELSVFGGKTRLVSTRQVSQPALSSASGGSQHGGGSHEDLVLHHSLPPPAYASSSSAGSFGIGFATGGPASQHAQPSHQPVAPTFAFQGDVDVHPSLVDQYHGFDGHLAAQVGSEYGREFRAMSMQTDIGGGGGPPPVWTMEGQEQEGHVQNMGDGSRSGIHAQAQYHGYPHGYPDTTEHRRALEGGAYAHHQHHEQQQHYVQHAQHHQSGSFVHQVHAQPIQRSPSDPLPQAHSQQHHHPSHGAHMYIPHAEHGHTHAHARVHPQQQHAQMQDGKQGNLNEMWSSFVQHLEVPNPASYQYQNR